MLKRIFLNDWEVSYLFDSEAKLLGWEGDAKVCSCLKGHFPKGNMLHLAPNWQGVSLLGCENCFCSGILLRGPPWSFSSWCLKGHLPSANLLHLIPYLHRVSLLGWLNYFRGPKEELLNYFLGAKELDWSPSWEYGHSLPARKFLHSWLNLHGFFFIIASIIKNISFRV